ncbi:MAG TPA: response regulator [Oscillatoriaceae cyanobacterium]
MSSPDRKRILIADDEPDLVRILSILLRAMGYDIDAAPDARTAIQMAMSSPPDLVILDVMMPGLNGYEACGKLKGDPATKHVPVLMISAKVQQADRLSGLEAGADAYLGKPFENSELLRQVRRLLGEAENA